VSVLYPENAKPNARGKVRVKVTVTTLDISGNLVSESEVYTEVFADQTTVGQTAASPDLIDGIQSMFEAISTKNKQTASNASNESQGASTNGINIRTGGAPTSPGKGDKDQKERKSNVEKQDSKMWKSFDNVKNSKLKTSGKGSKKLYYDWDYTHNDIEVYDKDGNHLGSMDPVTGEMYKPSKGYTINVN